MFISETEIAREIHLLILSQYKMGKYVGDNTTNVHAFRYHLSFLGLLTVVVNKLEIRRFRILVETTIWPI